MSVALQLDMPESALAAIRKSPAEFAAELRLAAAVKWYELGIVSQEFEKLSQDVSTLCHKIKKEGTILYEAL